jgi:hypothetical protein
LRTSGFADITAFNATFSRAAGFRPTLDLNWSAMRLRRLSEAECYARCYGAHRSDQVSVLKPMPRRPPLAGEELRRHFEQRLDARGPEQEAA